MTDEATQTVVQLMRELNKAIAALAYKDYFSFMTSSIGRIALLFDDRMDDDFRIIVRESLSRFAATDTPNRSTDGETYSIWDDAWKKYGDSKDRRISLLCRLFFTYAGERAGELGPREAAEDLSVLFDGPTLVPTGYGTLRLDFNMVADPKSPETLLLKALIAEARSISGRCD